MSFYFDILQSEHNYIACDVLVIFRIAIMTWYVVYRGRQTGVFATWEECHAQVQGFKGNCYQGYKTKPDAFEAYHKHAGDQGLSNDAPECTTIIKEKRSTSCKDVIIIIQFAVILVQFISILVLL